jgi:hypothetical protein
MRARLKFIIPILLLTIGNLLVYADGFNFRKYAGEFMEIGVDARAQSMGGAFTAVSGDVVSTYYNPAGIYDLMNTQISFMHTQQMIASVNYDFLAFGKKQSENRVLAISLVRLGIDNIKDSRQAYHQIQQTEDWNIDWSKVKQFNASDYIFTLSVAQKCLKDWNFGANFKLIRRNLADHHANGLGFDLGAQKKLWENAQIGVVFRNITTTLIAWDTGEKELVAPSFYLGGTYLINIPGFKSTIQPVGDIIIRAESRDKSASWSSGTFSSDFAAGLEYAYHGVLYIRAGIDEISRLNLGAGVQIPHIRIDYAFTRYDYEIGNSHRIGLLISL